MYSVSINSFDRWIYISVVEISAWPSNFCISIKFAPPSTKWVANECLKVWGETDFVTPAALTYFLMDCQIAARVNFFPLLLKKTNLLSEDFLDKRIWRDW